MYPPAINSSPKGPPNFLPCGGLVKPKISLPLKNWKKISKQTNNVAEYLGLFEGLRLCQAFEIKNVEIYGDSKLVIEQVKGKWKVKSPNLIPIHNAISELLNEKTFDEISFNHVLRKYNKNLPNM